MGVENAIVEAGDKGITVFEYFWESYPLWTFLILLGFFILIVLAVTRPKRVHYYEGQDLTGRYGSSGGAPRQVVVHQPAPQRQTVRQPISQPRVQPMERVVHAYDPEPEPVRYEEPVKYEQPIVQDRRQRRFNLNDFDLTDNYGFFD